MRKETPEEIQYAKLITARLIEILIDNNFQELTSTEEKWGMIRAVLKKIKSEEITPWNSSFTDKDYITMMGTIVLWAVSAYFDNE